MMRPAKSRGSHLLSLLLLAAVVPANSTIDWQQSADLPNLVDDTWHRGLRSDVGASNDKQTPVVETSTADYAPQVLDRWKVDEAAWSDQVHTWKDLGDFYPGALGHNGRKAWDNTARSPVECQGCRYAGFKYKVQTSVAQRTSSYVVTATSRSQIVVLAEGPSPPPTGPLTAAGWDTSCAGYSKIAGSSNYMTFTEGGAVKGMTWCARKVAQVGERITIPSSSGDRVDIFVTPDYIGDAYPYTQKTPHPTRIWWGDTPSKAPNAYTSTNSPMCEQCFSHSSCLDHCQDNYFWKSAHGHRRRGPDVAGHWNNPPVVHSHTYYQSNRAPNKFIYNTVGDLVDTLARAHD